jgi:hypothetical protein
MTKSIFIVSLILFLVSCNQNPNCQNIDKPLPGHGAATVAAANCTPTDSTGTPTDGTEVPGDVPEEAKIFDANFTLTNFDSHDEDKVTRAIAIIKKIVASQEFRTRVLNFSYGNSKTYVDNGGYTNAEIYQKLLDGSEELVPGIDHQMDLDLELYYSGRSTVGYTYADGLRIWMNSKFFDAYTPAEVAGNVFHEWTHKLGFTHASTYSLRRDSSVPYALGYLVEELGKQYE